MKCRRQNTKRIQYGPERLLRRFAATTHLPRQRKEDSRFLDRGDGLHADLVARRECVDDFLDQHLGADAPAVNPKRPIAPNLSQSISSARCSNSRGTAVTQRHFLEALGVRGIGRADHDHGVDHRGDALDRSWRLVVA